MIKVHVHAFCYNDEMLLPYFLRHYGKFCEKIVIHDNGSDDKSSEIVGMCQKSSMVQFETGGQLRDDILIEQKNKVWKDDAGKCDFVIVVDVDEFVYAPNIVEMLEQCKNDGKTILRPNGYNMVSRALPTTGGQIYDEIKLGKYRGLNSKPCVFDPNKIIDINFSVGAHTAMPVGWVDLFTLPDLKLLHYRYIGFDYYLKRQKMFAKRISDKNKQHGWSYQYWLGEDLYIKQFEDVEKDAILVI